jgi:hypothetical protein
MNRKLLALGAQKRFQVERERDRGYAREGNRPGGWKRERDSARELAKERERRTNQVSRSQIGRSDVASLALSGACFSCLLAHVFRPCMVLHRNRQHGSTRFFHSAKQLR